MDGGGGALRPSALVVWRGRILFSGRDTGGHGVRDRGSDAVENVAERTSRLRESLNGREQKATLDAAGEVRYQGDWSSLPEAPEGKR